MVHWFDTTVAQEYGIDAAVIFQHLVFWIEKNKANNENVYDGSVWTYNSVKAFESLFPYMTGKRIYTALKKLEDAGLIKTGNYNKASYDRTKWYALTEKGIAFSLQGNSILPTGKMEFTHRENGISPQGKAIPDNKHIYDTHIKNTDINIVVDYLNQVAGTRYRANTPKTAALISARLNDGFTVDDMKTVIEKKAADWIGTEWQKYLRPETLFGNKFESYLNAHVSKKGVATTDDLDALDGIF